MGAGTKKGRRAKGWIIFGVGIYSLVTLLPLYFVLINAFKTNAAVTANPYIISPRTFTLEGFKKAFRLLEYPTTIVNNIKLLVVSCILLIICASMAGYAISTARSKLLDGYYLLLIAAQTLPFMLAMVPIAVLLNNMKLINSHIGTSLVYTACTIAFGTFLYTGYMKALPKELYEAATVDGCNYFQTYWYIYMPLLKTVTGTVIILRGVFFWNDYLISFTTLTKPGLVPLTPRLYAFASTRLTSYDLLFSGTLLTIIPILIVFLAFQKVFVSGVTAGAVKG